MTDAMLYSLNGRSCCMIKTAREQLCLWRADPDCEGDAAGSAGSQPGVFNCLCTRRAKWPTDHHWLHPSGESLQTVHSVKRHNISYLSGSVVGDDFTAVTPACLPQVNFNMHAADDVQKAIRQLRVRTPLLVGVSELPAMALYCCG